MNLKKAIQNEIDVAFASFFVLIIGAIIPVFPFFFTSGVGAAITLITGKSFLKSGVRQVVFGIAAAAATFEIGHLIGISIVE